MTRYLSEQLRQTVFERAGNNCEYCLIAIADTYFGGEVDHIISIKHGGESIAANLALTCQSCNRSKGSDLGLIALTTRRLTRFFNPRRDKWSKHFRLNGAIIEPLSSIGEVTARIFGFNENDKTMERQGLININHFPPRAAAEKMK